ncbi:hypothetical protein IFU37_023040 (plasmid) [Pantoea agglomerans]|uniref:hypothetical protein n=1 Tax=Enterobacter agglomerans TaxID=549 RepID=UPI00177C0A3B|nr:hypothetical protein [Pantoea agglomerans]WVL92328.1 hypothetical protein IFU37_023040 [Pantoea agglomerans]
MSPQIREWREATIKLAAMKIAYRRAWQNKKTPVGEIVELLNKIETSEKYCRSLRRKVGNLSVSSY